jgi:F-type H+-transporting ATPase subunit b
MIRKGESMVVKLIPFPLLAATVVLALLAVAPVSSLAQTADPVEAVAEVQDDHPAEDGAGNGAGPAEDLKDPHEHGSSEHADTPPLLQFDIGSAVCNIAIFLGVLAILSKFVWPVILNGLKAREDKIHQDLEQAEQANHEAKELLTQYQTKLDDAAKQVQGMLADARKDSEAAGQKIIEQAKSEAERQRDRAVADIETAKKVALSDLAGKTSDMAIQVAKQIVGRELKAEDHAELIRSSLDRLPSNN